MNEKALKIFQVFSKAMFELYYLSFGQDITGVQEWINSCISGKADRIIGG